MSATHPTGHLDELPVELCWQLLRQHSVGRVAVGGSPGEAPAVHPVNYDVEGGTVRFRTTSEVVLHAIPGGPIAFEVDVIDHAHDAGWSVLARGRATAVEADAADPPHAWAGDRAVLVHLRVEQVTGRWVHRGEQERDGRGYL
jgi:hypothetical protein